MMENQEQNSQSEDTNPKNIEITPLAQPYRAVIATPKAVLQESFDRFWTQHGSEVVKASGYKGKKLKGGRIDTIKARKSLENSYGISKLYEHPISIWAHEQIDEQYFSLKEKVMLTTHSNLDNWETDEPVVTIVFYFWPKLHYVEDLNFEITRNVPRDPEKALEGRFKDLQHQHKYYEETETDELTEEMEVLLDITASIEDEAYAQATIQKNWLRIKDLRSKELAGSLLEHKKGDLYETSFPDPFKVYEEDGEPKIVTAQVKIHDARHVRFYDLDDPKLYELAKFETKEQFVEKFHQEYNEYMDNAERHLAFDEIMNQLTMKGKLEPIPQSWIETNASNFIRRHVDSVGGDQQKAMKAVGATSEDHYMDMGRSQILKDTVNRMAVRAYAAMYDLSDDPVEVANHILSQVKWVEKSE